MNIWAVGLWLVSWRCWSAWWRWASSPSGWRWRTKREPGSLEVFLYQNVPASPLATPAPPDPPDWAVWYTSGTVAQYHRRHQRQHRFPGRHHHHLRHDGNHRGHGADRGPSRQQPVGADTGGQSRRRGLPGPGDGAAGLPGIAGAAGAGRLDRGKRRGMVTGW